MKKSIKLLIILSMFFNNIAYSISFIDHQPEEMVVLQLSKDSIHNWKEILRFVTDKEGIVELIPLNQKVKNWSELICIEYIGRAILNRQMAISIDDSVDLIKKKTISSYPGNQVSWRIIEKNKSDIIYEWILHKPYKNIPAQHQISRAYLTEKGLHRIGFTRQYNEMTPDERDEWIKLMQKSIFIVSSEEVRNINQGLSLANKENSLDLGETFKDWEIATNYLFEIGYSIVTYTPPFHNKEYITECLEVTSLPVLNNAYIDQYFELEKKSAQKESLNKLDIIFFKKSPTEIIYSFVYPHDNLLVTAITRSFISNGGYYSLCCKHGHPEALKKEEIMLWIEQLENVKVK